MGKTKITLILIICFILIIPNTIAEACNPDVNIHLNFVSLEQLYSKPSKYTFPIKMRENDYLFLNYISIENTRECQLPKSYIELLVKPSEGYTPKDKHPENYGEYIINIPPLDKGDKYEIFYKEPLKSDIKLNGDILFEENWWHWPILLDELGDWVIEPNLEIKKYPNDNSPSAWGYSTYINGDNKIKRFRVYSMIELENRETSRMSFYVALVALIITFISLIIDIFVRLKNNNEKEKINLLRKILKKISSDRKTHK